MKYIIVSIMFFVPFAALNAQVVISEVMYNLEGPDDKHEWIEISNTGAESVDLTNWKFNDGSNHGLNIPPEKGGQGLVILSSGEYAILTGNADTFLIDHPSFSGTVIDTVMSLNNTSDTLSLIDTNGTTEDSMTYTSEQGAYEDGNSLQLISGSWNAATPTPGIQKESSSGKESGQEGSSFPVDPVRDSGLVPRPISNGVKQQIFADAGGDRSVVVGADTLFEGKSLGLKKEPLLNARYVWNFGNGEIKEGQNVLHYYGYPGEYVVMLNVSSSEYSVSDRIIVNAYPAELVISEVNEDFVEIYNKSTRELNLSWWQLRSGSERFMIPKDTIILSGRKLIFSSDITGLDTSVKENISLLYPNGVEAVSFSQIVIPQKTVVTKKAVVKSQPIVIEETPAIEKETQENIIQTASVIASLNDEDKKGGMTKWLLAIFSIIVVSAGAVVFAGYGKKELGDEIEIIE